MTREDGLKQIDEAKWQPDRDGCLNLFVHGDKDKVILCWLQLRPHYCDRGHIQLNIDIERPALCDDVLDAADGFPRYFFSFEEADKHTRLFLKWRLWKERAVPYSVHKELFASAGSGK